MEHGDRLNEKKAAQVAARFLLAAGGRMPHLKLVKLMYLLDRRALLEWGWPVLNDMYWSLPHGPIQSGVYDLILSESGFWADHISSPSEHVVTLLDETGNDELSEAEETLIDEVFAQFGKWDRFKLRDYTHTLPEWTDPHGSSRQILIEEILRAGGKADNDIAVIVRDLAGLREADARLS